MRGLIALMVAVGLAGLARGPAFAPGACPAPAVSAVRTTLYFGLSRPRGVVSETEWRRFLKDEVTPRVPDGLTVMDGQGQWRAASGASGRERTKIVLIEHPGTAVVRRSIQTIIAAYKKAFAQESVLWESETVCAAN